MLIYGALIIPLFTSVYLLMFHRKDSKWWEFLLIYGVAILSIMIPKVASESAQVHAIEYWGHIAAGIVHEEPYSYETTCSRQNCSGSGKNRSCTTVYYSCVKNVSRACYLVYPTRTDGGSGDELQLKSYRISYSKYKQLDTRWKNNGHKFKQKHRDHYNRKNHGGLHRVYWDKEWTTAEPLVYEHSYVNKVQASDSVFNFEEVTEQDVALYGLYTYPDVSSGYESVTIMDHTKNWNADAYWRYINGYLGPKKKLRMWVLIFKGMPQTAASMQEALWKGSNKNEFIFCIGTDNDYNITWSKVITWSESQELKIHARNFVSTEMKTVSEESLLKLGKWSADNLGSSFEKVDWKQFDYLKVSPSTTAIIIAYVITLIVCIGVAFWVVKNQFHDHGGVQPRR